MEIIWSEFKKIVDIKQLSIQFVQHSGNYHLKAIDGVFALECAITLDSTNPDTLDFETNYKAKGNKKISTVTAPFASKILANGKKLFTRIHGTQITIDNAGTVNIDFTIPYAACKITGLRVIGGKLGDNVNLKILDTATGANTTIPHYQLNQFGFNMNVAAEDHVYLSDYDADLTQNLVIRMQYTALSVPIPRLLCINFILHEVKD